MGFFLSNVVMLHLEYNYADLKTEATNSNCNEEEEEDMVMSSNNDDDYGDLVTSYY